MPGPRPDESARLRETTPGGYRIRPYGKSLPPPLRFVCRAGCPHPAAGRRGRRPLQWRTANFPAMADARGGLWAGRPTHRPQKGHPSRDYCNPVVAGHARPAAWRKRPSAGTTPGGYRIRPYGKSLPPLLRFVCTAVNRGRTSRKPIFQQQPPPVVENFPGGRRFIVRK